MASEDRSEFGPIFFGDGIQSGHSFIRITNYLVSDWQVLECHVIGIGENGERLEHDFRGINQIEILSTRWAHTGYTVNGVVTPINGLING